MWWYGRGNCGGSWLPEEKKANMWYERGNSGGSWPPAFPCSPNQLQNLNSKINFFGSNILFSSVFDLEGFVLADVGYFSVKIYFFIFRKKNLFYNIHFYFYLKKGYFCTVYDTYGTTT